MEFILFASAVLFIGLVYLPYRRKKKEEVKEMFPGIEMAIKETQLVNSMQIPTDEDIKLYYKMYLKKWEIDHTDKWETEIVKPMDWEEWEKIAKTIEVGKPGGYRFIVGKTMDMFIGIPPNMQMMRYRDYRQMVEDDENEKNQQMV